MTGEDDQDRARIAELRDEITERLDELDKLITRVKNREQPRGRPPLTLLPGGRLGAAMALPITALIRRPRHQVALAVTAAAAGALAAVLVIPGHTQPGARGYATSDLSIPWAPPWSSTPTTGSTPAATTAPSKSAPSAVAASTPGPATVPVIPVATSTAPGPTGSPSEAPSKSATGTGPSPSTTAVPSTSCLIEVTVTGVLDVCVL